jgi:cytochrome P450
MTEIRYEPLSPEVSRDPYPFYEEMRREAPVYRIPSSGFYTVSRYRDVMRVLKDPEVFSSSAMRLMMMSAMTGGIQNMPLDLDQIRTEREKVAKQLSFDPAMFLTAQSVISSDPPQHKKLRSIVNRGFAPRRIAALEPRVREIARGLLDRMLSGESGSFDLVRDYSIPLPVQVIAELIGVDAEKREDFKRWSDTVVSAASGSAAGPQEMIATFGEFTAYFTEVIERRRVEPAEDLISALIRAEQGDALSPVEVIMFAILLLVAGNETTTNLIGNGTRALLDHPDQLEKVRANPTLIPAFVEEALRYDSPVQVLFRQAKQDVEVAGTKIPKGSIVLPIFASANRDDDQFPEASRFDITRNPQGHVAFGFGIHFCLGSSLARLEAKVAFEELLSRITRLEQIDSDIEYVDSFLLRGPKNLRLRFEAA